MPNRDNGRYVIDPRHYRTDRFYAGFMIVFWLIWAPATVAVTYLACTQLHPFFFVWLVFGYLGTLGIPFIILNRNRKQILEVAGDSIIIKGTRVLPTSKVHIHARNLRALTLEHYDDNSGKESVYTLNLFQKTGVRPKRVMLAQFVHPRDKAILFEEIGTFLQNHGFQFDVKNEMAQK